MSDNKEIIENNEEVLSKDVISKEDFESTSNKAKKEKKPAIGSSLESLTKDKGRIIKISLVVIAILIMGVLLFSPPFRVKEYRIEGNYQISDDEIASIMELQTGRHIFLGFGKGIDRLMSYTPYITDVKISRKIPSIITITVVERQKVAYIASPDGYIAIDNQGVVVEFEDNTQGNKTPLLHGIVINEATLGEKIDISNETDFQKVITILGTVLNSDQGAISVSDYSFYENLIEIRILPSGYIFLTINLPNNSSLVVKLDSIEKIVEDMNWLTTALNNNSLNDLPDGVLDMTGEEYIYRPYEEE